MNAMTSYFAGGAVGTFVGVQCWHIGGWPTLTWQLFTWAIASLLVALSSYRKQWQKK